MDLGESRALNRVGAKMGMRSQSDYSGFPNTPTPHNSRGVWDWFKVETGPSAGALAEFGRVGTNDNVIEVWSDMAGAIRMMHADTGAPTNYATIFFFREQAC